jgi:hypothetical protein
MDENRNGQHHIDNRSRLMRRGMSEMKKFESGEIGNAGRSVREFQVEMKGESNTRSGDCPECSAPLLRVSLEDLAPVDNGTKWTRRFVDHSSAIWDRASIGVRTVSANGGGFLPAWRVRSRFTPGGMM